MVEGIEGGTARRGQQLRIILWAGAGAFLLLPLVAMQFTRAVAWDLADFAVAGTMIATTGIAYELAVLRNGNALYRAAVAVALAAALAMVWANLAVGIIGDEGNPANLMFGGVLAIGIGGAALARLRAHGMARALTATALAQFLVAVVAATGGLDLPAPVTAFFTGLWLLAAWLFRQAARDRALSPRR